MEALKVVIIEDEEAHFQLMKRAIHKAFPEVGVEHFFDADACLERLDGIAPDVVIADYLMPGMNGIEFLKAFKPGHKDIPVIIITGQGDEHIAVQAMKDGASDYLVKAGDFFALVPGVIERVFQERRLRDSLERSENRFKQIFEQSPIGIALCDRSGLLIDANKSWLEIFGVTNLTERRGLALDYWKISPEDDMSLLQGKTVRFQVPFDFQRARQESGHEMGRSGTVHLDVLMTPMAISEGGSTDGTLVQLQDITEEKEAKEALQRAHDELEERVESRTAQLVKANEILKQEIEERRRAEKALGKSEERYRRIVETAQEGIWVIDADAKVKYVNQQLADMLGYTIEEILGTPLFDFVFDLAAVDVHQKVERRERELLKQHDFRLRRKDNSDLWAMISSTPMFDENGRHVGALGMVVDITKRKQAEDGLRESEKKYSSLVENSLIGINIDQDGKIVFSNNRFAEIYGYRKEELAYLEMWRLVHPDDRALVDQVGLGMLRAERGPAEYEIRGLRKDGGPIWIRSRNVRIDYMGRPAILGNVVDVTLQKETEEKLRRSNEDIRNFLEFVSHDLKNPIFAIKGFAGLLLRRFEAMLDDKGREFLEQITSSADRMALLISDLLTFSRIDEVVPTVEDVPVLGILKAIISSLQERIEKDHIELVVQEDIPTIQCHRDGMYQVFDNLLTNAVKFTKGADRPRVEVGYADGGNFHRFWVKDNGVGIEPCDQDKIFEMFQRLKQIEDEEGTGLGLSIVKKAVTENGGKVWVESAKGHGATFHFTWPKLA